MPLTDIAVEATLWTNHALVDLVEMENEPGLVEVERADSDEVAIHFRHVNDESATVSAYLTRAQAAVLLTTLRAATE